MDIYNMASFPHPGSPEWMWYQQIRMKIQDESSGPTLADFQAFNLRPRGQAPQRNMRPRFIQTGSRPRVPAPPYHMLNHGQHNMRCSTSPSMVRNSTPQGMVRNNAPQGIVRHNTPQGMLRNNIPQGMMRHSIPQGMMRSNTPQGMARNGIPQSMISMNPRLYEPPVHSRPSSNPIEGLQELVNLPQGPSPPINQCISPANQRVSMDSTPRGPSPLSYMETSQTVSHQVPPSGLQVRGHLHSNLQPNTSQHLSNSGMRMPVSINSRPIWFPPPLMKADGTLIRPMEHFSGPWTSQPGNVGYRPGLPYTLTADGNRSYHDQIRTAALHGGQVPNLSVSTNCNETNFHQASSFENTNSINKDSDEETQSSQANGTLSNSIFGRWYKPPSVDEEVKYDYIFDVDGDAQTNRTERSDQENTQTKSSSHLIKRPSKLSHEKKGTKGKRLEGEISRIFSSFQSQLSPLSSDSLPESRTWCETEPDIFSGRSGNNKISSDQSHSQAATSINTLSSTKVGSSIHQQFSSSAIESNLSQNVAKEVDRNCSQDSINHPQAAPTITSTNAQAIQQVHCTTNRPMPPLMLAPMTYIKPVGLQSSQQFQPPALTVLSTNHSASFQKQSTVPVVLQSGSVNSSAGNSSSNSADHLGNSQEESNICILDTFSLSRPHVSDIVIQPQELNVNLVSNSPEPNVGKDTASQDQVKTHKRKSSEHDSDSKIVVKEKKVTPLRIRLPFALKSRLREKVKSNASKNKKSNGVKEKPAKRPLLDCVSSVPEEHHVSGYSAAERLESQDPLISVVEKGNESLVYTEDKDTNNETVQCSVAFDSDNSYTNKSTLLKSSLPTTSNIETDHNEKQSQHMESSLNCPDKLSVADKNTHNTEKPNDPHHLADKLKEVVSKISSGRKRRKSAVLLDSQPITPDAKRRRLSKEKELDSYGSCSKSVGTIDKNVQEQNSVVAKSCVMDDKSKDAGEYCEKSSGGFVVLPNTYNASISDSRNTLSSKEPSHHSSSSSSVNTSATEMHKDKALETEVATDDDLPKIVRSARLRKVRVSKRPWLMKTKETNVAESQSETEDPEGFVNKIEEESNNSKGPCMEKSKEKKKSEIEKCQERTKSLRLELRRISFPPTSLKNLDSKSNETDTAMVKQGPEKEKESGKRNLNKGFDMEGLGKAVSGQQSAETELECMEKYGGSVNDNMNNNSSIVSRDSESTSTIIPVDSPIIVKESNSVSIVCDTEPITEVSAVGNTDDTVTESLTGVQTDSPVTGRVVSNDKIEIHDESEGDVEVINVSHKPKDTFDINIVNDLFFPVEFHGSKLMCITCLSGKYFVVRELLNKCFIDIAEKNKKRGVFLSKLFKQVYVAKERDLNIPYVELPGSLRTSIGDYLMKEQLLRKSLVCHIGIIHVNDAKRLYHFFYGVKSCHDLKCVLPWSSNDSIETTKHSDEIETRQDELKSEKDVVVDVETGTTEKDVEIITCQVIFDREVKESPDLGNTETQENTDSKNLARSNSSLESENCLKVPKISSRNGGDPSNKQKKRMMLKKMRGRLAVRSGDRSDLSDDSDATIPYMDEPEPESDVECDKSRLSSSSLPKDFENSGTYQSCAHSSNMSSDSTTIIDNSAHSTNNDLVTANSDIEDSNSDDQQESRIDPDLNEDYVVRGGIAELYDGMFRFLVINGRKFFPFEDLCQHYEKEDLINCLKSKPGHFKAIRCSVIETDFLNNLEPTLPVLVENATIIEEDFLHCSAKLNFRKLFDSSEQEVVDLTTEDDAVVPQRLADSPVLTPEASPTLTNPCKLSAFESFSNEDMLVDTSDDILMMELGTANCDTRGKESIHTKGGSSEDDLSAIDGREQKAVADAFRDIWVENHSLKSKMALMTQDFEETKKETMDFEATCQQYGDAIELMTKAMQQTCSEDRKKDLS